MGVPRVIHILLCVKEDTLTGRKEGCQSNASMHKESILTAGSKCQHETKQNPGQGKEDIWSP